MEKKPILVKPKELSIEQYYEITCNHSCPNRRFGDLPTLKEVEIMGKTIYAENTIGAEECGACFRMLSEARKDEKEFYLV